MAIKTWQEWPETCDNCGGLVEVFTEETEDGWAFEGDLVRCVACGCRGVMLCDSDSCAEILWDGEEEEAL